MYKIELTESDFYAIIEAFAALKESAQEPCNEILLDEELKTVKNIDKFIKENNLVCETCNKIGGVSI